MAAAEPATPGPSNAAAAVAERPALERIRDRLARGRDRQAEAELDGLLEREPQNLEVLRLRAEHRLSNYQWKDAGEDAAKYLSVRPEDAAVLTIRAAARMRSRPADHAGARSDLDLAVRVEPRHAAAWRWRARLSAAERNYAEAAKDASEAIRLEPRQGENWLVRGSAHLYSGELTAAEADLDRAVEMMSAEPEAGFLRALLRLRLGQGRLALEDAHRAVVLLPYWPAARRTRGIALLATGDARSAVADFRAVASMTVDGLDYAHLFIWAAQIRAGEAPAAEKEILRYLAVRNPVGGDAWSELLLRMAAGEVPEEDVLNAGPELRGRASPEGQQAEACFYVAMQRLASGDRPSAIEFLRRAKATTALSYFEHHLAIAFLPTLEASSASGRPAAPRPPAKPAKRRPRGGVECNRPT